MEPPKLIQDAVKRLCLLFESGGYALTPVIDIGALVANADGTVDEKELEMLHYLFRALLGADLGHDLVEHLVRGSLQIILEAGLAPRARFLAEILLDCGAAEEGLLVAFGVAYASEGLSASEREVIDLLANAAHVSKSRVDELSEQVRRVTEAA
ncbi:MAG TPA: hypothetical protein VGM56_19940 [Byssovorax sp.]|jgi:tellurite resistance protein